MTKKQQIYWFYKNEKINLVEIDDKFSFNFFKPTIFNLKLHNGTFLVYLFWYTSRGRAVSLEVLEVVRNQKLMKKKK